MIINTKVDLIKLNLPIQTTPIFNMKNLKISRKNHMTYLKNISLYTRQLEYPFHTLLTQEVQIL